MSCNAFYIRISVRKCPEHFFLLFKIRLKRIPSFTSPALWSSSFFQIWYGSIPKRTFTYGRQSVQKSLASSQVHSVLLKFPSKLTVMFISFAAFRQFKIRSLHFVPRAGVIPLRCSHVYPSSIFFTSVLLKSYSEKALCFLS